MDYSYLDLVPVPVLVVDENFGLLFVNKRARELYGDGVGTCYALSHGFDRPCSAEDGHPCPMFLLNSEDTSPQGTIHVHRTREGNKYFYVLTQPVKEEKAYIELHIDLSDVVKSPELAVAKPELVMSSGPVVFFLWENSEGWPVKFVSPNVVNLFGYSAEEFLTGKVSYPELVHPEDLPRVAEEVKRYSEQGVSSWTHEDYRILTRDGKVKWVLDHTVPIFGRDRDITHYYGYLIDITEKHEQEELFRKLAESNPNGVILFNFKNNSIIYANRAVSEITGYSEEELESLKDPLILIHPKDKHIVIKNIQRRIKGERKPFSYSVRFLTKGGKTKWVKIVSSVITYRGEESTLVTLIDITKEKARERKLHTLATHDQLTGVYNRRALLMFFEKYLHSARRYGIPFSVILIDLDNFKYVNDQFGHQTGDRVLKTFAKLVKGSLRRTDVFGRWGGEEFLALLPFNDKPYMVAEKLRRKVEETEFSRVGRVTASFGATTYREGDDIDSMMARADEALYEAKRKGKNTTVVV
ncbi:diguanylate cyclase [Hydrogenivirga sp. 128-5-R1-1]|uniref:diguanylate cyclase n=1 Tax=Hydrogenivirga sp. 128-5-R1-1 TaxID=392423 RepID=UPI00015F1800|nr:diguanylate cyclase [Hydrogenivirga sp. 128-5-R1-1]EDP75526.1 diguanylate cyclase (GGDEF domain) with PAS/PAC sensor [Hydrogenivirga sp. 128-5-R1-1]